MTVRDVAARALASIERGRRTLATEIDRARPALSDERDRGLLLELTAGTLRWRGELDALLAQCTDRPIAGLDEVIRNVLRIGAYQLEHLARIPRHAAVHEAVESARRLGRARAAGFVNAVLRRFVRDRTRLRLPPRPADGALADQVAYLSTSLSHPAWLVERWLARWGFEAAERWCRFDNEPPELALRVLPGDANDVPQALHAAGVETAPGRFLRDVIRLPPGSWAQVPPEIRERLFVHDEAAADRRARRRRSARRLRPRPLRRARRQGRNPRDSRR